MKQSCSKLCLLAYYSTLKMEAIFSSETSVKVHLTTRCYIPDHSLQNANSSAVSGQLVVVEFDQIVIKANSVILSLK
jgi:hypothetical protein